MQEKVTINNNIWRKERKSYIYVATCVLINRTHSYSWSTSPNVTLPTLYIFSFRCAGRIFRIGWENWLWRPCITLAILTSSHELLKVSSQDQSPFSQRLVISSVSFTRTERLGCTGNNHYSFVTHFDSKIKTKIHRLSMHHLKKEGDLGRLDDLYTGT